MGVIERVLKATIKVFTKLISSFNECVRTSAGIGDFQSLRLYIGYTVIKILPAKIC